MRITWVATGLSEQGGKTTSALASSRYRALLPADALRKAGIETAVLDLDRAPEDPSVAVLRSSDVVVLQKLLPDRNGFGSTIAKYRRVVDQVPRNAKLVLDVNDDHFADPAFLGFYRFVIPRAAGWVVSTEYLAKRLRAILDVGAVVVPDMFEGEPGIARAPVQRVQRWLERQLNRIAKTPQTEPALTVLWFGHPSNLRGLADSIPELLRAAERVPLALVCVTNASEDMRAAEQAWNAAHAPRLRVKTLEWSPTTTREALQECDMVIIPADLQQNGALAKSANRLLETIAAGRFAVCHPVPSYLEFQRFAWIGERLDEGMLWAAEHPREALRRVRAGQRYVTERYGPAVVSARWHDALKGFKTVVPPALRSPDDRGPLRLNLGCGGKLLSGYVNVDTAPNRLGTEPDVVCDIRDLRPFADATAYEVLAVHVLQRFPPWEGEGLLREWIRVLRPGGRLVIECPNLAYACEQIACDPALASHHWTESTHLMWVLYGDPNWRDPLAAHRWGYTPRSLTDLLRRVGLEEVRQEPAQFKRREPRDMRVVGIRPAALPFKIPADSVPQRAERPELETRAPSMPLAQAGETYVRSYYDTGVWKEVMYRGVRTLKNVIDLWNYQEIFAERKIEWVLETGTRHGGSALYFADLLQNAEAPGLVITVDLDFDALQIPAHEKVHFVRGGSTSPPVLREIGALLPPCRGPLFVILDSDHRSDHVLRELEVYVPLMLPGDYLVVEDTCINGHPVRPDFGSGPWEAVDIFLQRYPGLLTWDRQRELKFGVTFAPRGYFIRV